MKRVLDPHTTDRREPLEILAMLAGRTNFPRLRGPGATRSQQPITPMDVAHALANARDALGAAMGMAIACQREHEWGKVHDLSYTPLLSELQHQRAFPGVVQGPKRFRVRIVLYDAFHDLIWPARRAPTRIAAKNAGMEKRAYGFLHHHVTGFLHARANTAALDACIFLFTQVRFPRATTTGEDAEYTHPAKNQPLWTAPTPTSDEAFNEMVLALLADVVRSPQPGLLHLPNKCVESFSPPIDSEPEKAIDLNSR